MPQKNLYRDRISGRIDAIHPGISASLSRISYIDLVIARAVLCELLGYACQAADTTNITTAREMIGELPSNWLEQHLRTTAAACLNLDDDWEYRRLMELLHEVSPGLMVGFVCSGGKSSNPDVRKAAQDYASGRYGPVLGLGD